MFEKPPKVASAETLNENLAKEGLSEQAIAEFRASEIAAIEAGTARPLPEYFADQDIREAVDRFIDNASVTELASLNNDLTGALQSIGITADGPIDRSSLKEAIAEYKKSTGLLEGGATDISMFVAMGLMTKLFPELASGNISSTIAGSIMIGCLLGVPSSIISAIKKRRMNAQMDEYETQLLDSIAKKIGDLEKAFAG
jgi:ABC-type xylose transport system substrate-binding protein